MPLVQRPFLFRLRALLHAGFVLVLSTVVLPGPLEAIGADYGADLDEPLSDRALAQHEAMATHFRAPFDGYGPTEVFVPPFAAIFLSNAAIGFMNVERAAPERHDEVAALLEEVTRRALSAEVSPYHLDPRDVRQLGDHNLYLSHLSLVLGARRVVVGDERYDALHERVSRHLVRRSLSSPTAHARSYPGSSRFPADQTALLASLHLYDRIHGTRLAERPIAAWLRYMERHGTDPGSGLHRSSVTPSFRHASAPRGCALSFSTLYATQFAPEVAADQYRRYRERFLVHRAGLGGFREYPAGLDAGMDGDSGPVLFGVGAAATGFGLGAARISADREAYRAISRTAATVGLPTPLSAERRYRLSPMLGEAILFHGLTARRWEEPAPAPRCEREAPFPTAPFGLVIALLSMIALSLRRAYRLLLGGQNPNVRAPTEPHPAPQR